jgi:hypothetical protein
MRSKQTRAGDESEGSTPVDLSKAPAQASRRRMLGCMCCWPPVFILLGLAVFGWWVFQDEPQARSVSKHSLSDKSGSSVLLNPEDAKQLSRMEQSLVDALPSFHVESQDLDAGKLNIARLVFDATDVDFNVRELLQGEQVKIRSFDTARIELRISAAELRSKIIPLVEKKGLKDVQIAFGNNSVKITAKKKIKHIGSIKVSASGSFYVVGGSGIALKVSELESGQFNIGVSSMDLKFEELLPPLDLGESFARIVIDKLQISSEHLQVSAHAERIDNDQRPKDAIKVLGYSLDSEYIDSFICYLFNGQILGMRRDFKEVFVDMQLVNHNLRIHPTEVELGNHIIHEQG